MIANYRTRLTDRPALYSLSDRFVFRFISSQRFKLTTLFFDFFFLLSLTREQKKYFVESIKSFSCFPLKMLFFLFCPKRQYFVFTDKIEYKMLTYDNLFFYIFLQNILPLPIDYHKIPCYPIRVQQAKFA